MKSILISNRGNLYNIDSDLENTPIYIEKALKEGFFVVIDILLVGKKNLALGINQPLHHISLEYIKNSKIIVRTNNINTLEFLINNQVHCFLDDNFNTSLTTAGFIWSTHKLNLSKRCIFNMPEWILNNKDIKQLEQLPCAGICSNIIGVISDERRINCTVLIQKYCRRKLTWLKKLIITEG
tara:strand:+ start:4264 stop:4809 length:546 start_codon:yes stop_codon:yes gene_type:complete